MKKFLSITLLIAIALLAIPSTTLYNTLPGLYLGTFRSTQIPTATVVEFYQVQEQYIKHGSRLYLVW